MKFIKKAFIAISSIYSPGFAVTLVYMLQNTEYRVLPYLAWFWRTQNFNNVAKRRKLVKTKVAKLLLIKLWGGMLVEILVGLWLIYLWHWHNYAGGWAFGLALIVGYPVIWAQLVVIPVVIARLLIIRPNEKRLIAESEQIFSRHKGIKIAIAGSYGKTSMKELLFSVLSAGKQVKATPGNLNVPLSHARFARTLSGKEDILLIEYGEGAPGDVARFAKTTHPTHGVITGIAPAHLDRYKTIHQAGKDIFSLGDYLGSKNIYVNGESDLAKPFIKDNFNVYTSAGALGWKVHNVSLSLSGTEFVLTKGKRSLNLKSGLVGRHHLGPLSLSAAMASEFGLSAEQVVAGIKSTKPFEHRMQPYKLNSAWIIDDTYNGTIEGIRAGTLLLNELIAKRKVYVTPGLVDQGKEANRVHQEMGRLIAEAKPDIVVLMKNSVTQAISRGLKEAGYNGELRVETDPLGFYSNLGEFVASGDIVMLQNDWTDNYA